MSKSLWDVNEERKSSFKTKNNTYSDFPVGTKVRVICICQDFVFFGGHETGTVISNEDRYLSIIIEFDDPIYFKDGTVLKSFNFNPDDLIIIEKTKVFDLNKFDFRDNLQFCY